eukprot:3937282-Rhodomonas_salina.1
MQKYVQTAVTIALIYAYSVDIRHRSLPFTTSGNLYLGGKSGNLSQLPSLKLGRYPVPGYQGTGYPGIAEKLNCLQNNALMIPGYPGTRAPGDCSHSSRYIPVHTRVSVHTR